MKRNQVMKTPSFPPIQKLQILPQIQQEKPVVEGQFKSPKKFETAILRPILWQQLTTTIIKNLQTMKTK